MQTDDPNYLTLPIEEPHIPLNNVHGLLREHLRRDISPYSLEIDCTALRQWSEKNNLNPFRHQDIIHELRAWSDLFSKRPIQRIWLNEPFEVMDAPSLTELIYAIGQNMKLLRSQHVEHTATLQMSDISVHNIALLKGLKFNHIQIHVTKEYDLTRLQCLKKVLENFKITYISLELDFDASTPSFVSQVMDILSFLAPDAIALSKAMAASLEIDDTKALTKLSQTGYFLHTATNTILKPNSPLQSRPADSLNIGPNAISQIGSLKLHNLSTLDAYRSRLHNTQIPVANCQ